MKLQIINNKEFGNIRVQKLNDEPWFVAKDLTDILGYGQTIKALQLLDDDEKLRCQISTSGQNRNMYMVNESGLYNLIFRSTKPIAKEFRKWVTSEVLPSIRKTGRYSVRPKTEGVLQWYKGALCITFRWLAQNEIMTRSNISKHIERNIIIRVRRSGHGRSALLLYSSIPPRHRATIERKFGTLPVPSPSVLPGNLKQIVEDITLIDDRALRMQLMQRLLPSC